ncbi:MAG: hypothetical protein ABIJ09_09435, partial [Pseudomonadota bacterium]
MTTRIALVATLALAMSGCNALKLVSGDRTGLACSTEQGCGDGYVCDPGTQQCVKDSRDGGASDREQTDRAGTDRSGADAASPDTTTGPDTTSTGPWNLTLAGSGFMGATGSIAYAMLVDATDQPQAALQSTSISSGGFAFTWSGALNAGVTYSVHVYFDLDNDGQCDFGSEGSFDVAVGQVSSDRTVTLLPTTPQADICATFNASPTDAGPQLFDLTINGAGFGSNLTNTLHLDLHEGTSPALATSRTVIINSDAPSSTMSGVLNLGASYTLVAWVDLDADGSCGAGDIGWAYGVGPVHGDQTLAVDASDLMTDVCAPPDLDAGSGPDSSTGWFDFSITLSGFAADAPFEMLVYNATDPGSAEGFRLGAAFDASGVAQVQQQEVLAPAGNYIVLLFVERDGSEGCTTPPDEVYEWRISPVSTGVNLAFDHATSTPMSTCEQADLFFFAYLDAGNADGAGLDAAPASYSLRVLDSDLTIYDAKKAFSALEDHTLGTTAQLGEVGTVASGALDVTLSDVLEAGHDYTVLLLINDGSGCQASDLVLYSALGVVNADQTVEFDSTSSLTTCGRFDDRPWRNHNIVFVTSNTINETEIQSSLAGADQFCRDAANVAGLPAQQYIAWLSGAGVSAPDRLSADLGWVRPDGQAFALSKDWLLAGQVLAPPSVDETGDMWSALTSVFTGTLANGTTSSNCSDWS